VYSGFAFGMGVERSLMFRKQRGRHAGHGGGRRTVQPVARGRSTDEGRRFPGSASTWRCRKRWTGRDIGDALIRAGLEVEGVEPATEISGPLTVGRVLSYVDEPQKNGRTIRWCRVDVGAYNENASEPDENGGSRGIVCGAHNFDAGDLVVVALPGPCSRVGSYSPPARRTATSPTA